MTVLLQLYSVAGQQPGLISIIASGPAAGFSEESTFNITCTSSLRPGNITWALPNPNDELDNLSIKVELKINLEVNYCLDFITVASVRSS